MAYYPLKVKDSGGNVHVVGDPRTSSKADSSALTAHTSATTSVHGIADTSALETTTGAQAKADAAEAAANAYTDTAVSGFEALPTQTGNSGKYLTTDGTSASWGVVDTSTQAVVTISSTSTYTLNEGADGGKILVVTPNGGGTTTIIVYALSLAIGQRIDFIQAGSGTVAFDNGNDPNYSSWELGWQGPQILSKDAKLTTTSAGSGATLVRTGILSYVLIGDLA